MESNISACVFIRLDFLDKIGGSRVVKVNTSIRGARYELLSIWAEITLDRKTRNTMAFVPLVFVELERGSGREYSDIICIRLRNKIRIKRVVPNTRTSIGFNINLQEVKEVVSQRQSSKFPKHDRLEYSQILNLTGCELDRQIA